LIVLLAMAGAVLAGIFARRPLPLAYGVPVTLGGVFGGWGGGIVTALTAVAALLALPPGVPPRSLAVDAVILIGLGALAGGITGRERRLRRHYQDVAKQLSSVYQSVQANFEGMKRAERLSAIGQLSAGLAHEIRNPLASISGAAAILERSTQFDPKNAKCLDIITKECRRLDGLLTNFLNFARPRPPRFETVALEPVLDGVLALASHGLRGKRVNLEKRIAPDLPPGECDSEQLEQVLLNLMINAIEASPDGETVILAAAGRDSRICIDVIDRGHGVAPAHVDRLFDPFFTTKEHGTGLGLPVAHQIMSQMGGSLLARKNPEEGMTFSVIIPVRRLNA
jgi:signal transduction histidine kinase